MICHIYSCNISSFCCSWRRFLERRVFHMDNGFQKPRGSLQYILLPGGGDSFNSGARDPDQDWDYLVTEWGRNQWPELTNEHSINGHDLRQLKEGIDCLVSFFPLHRSFLITIWGLTYKTDTESLIYGEATEGGSQTSLREWGSHFLNSLYAHRGARTHGLEIKHPTCYQLSQLGTPMTPFSCKICSSVQGNHRGKGCPHTISSPQQLACHLKGLFPGASCCRDLPFLLNAPEKDLSGARPMLIFRENICPQQSTAESHFIYEFWN